MYVSATKPAGVNWRVLRPSNRKTAQVILETIAAFRTLHALKWACIITRLQLERLPVWGLAFARALGVTRLVA